MKKKIMYGNWKYYCNSDSQSMVQGFCSGYPWSQTYFHNNKKNIFQSLSHKLQWSILEATWFVIYCDRQNVEAENLAVYY